jgi:hypothetical protein
MLDVVRYAECHYAGCLFIMLKVIRYAECRCTE